MVRLGVVWYVRKKCIKSNKQLHRNIYIPSSGRNTKNFEINILYYVKGNLDTCV